MSLRSREWPLVAFTLLTQAAVGAAVAGAGAWLAAAREGAGAAAASVLRGTWILSAVVFWIGVGASAFHLARPWAAILALRNVRRSWVSIEVTLAPVVGALLAALALLPPGAAAGALTGTILGTTVISGAGLLWAMGRIYRLQMRPAWDSVRTPMSFAATAVSLGSLAAAAALTRGGHGPAGPPAALPGLEGALSGAAHILAAAGAAALLADAALALAAVRARRRQADGASISLTVREGRRRDRIDRGRAVVALGAAATVAVAALSGGGLAGAHPPAARGLLAALALATVQSVIGRARFYEDGERPLNGL